jgi:FKBP-type peptidyl-prolyl cis-trans isomerase
MSKKWAVAIALGLILSPLAFAADETQAPKKEPAPKEEKAAKDEKAPKEASAPAGDLKTFSQRLSYAMGVEIAGSLKELKKDIDLDTFLRGFKDGLAGNKSLLTEEQTEATKKEFIAKMQAERAEKNKVAGEKNLKEGAAYLAENAKKKGIVTTKSGLQYEVLKEGAGAVPKASDTVKVQYRGTLVDGTEFDSSYKRNEPATFPVTGVIPGWTEGLQLMKVGGKYRLAIPAELAYKENGPGPIGPNAVLLFEVELVGIEQEPPGGGASPRIELTPVK